MRHDALVGDARVHTKSYGEQGRIRLGLAVTRAREAAGHPFRPSFARAAGISVRSLFKLETGVPVGPVVYEAVARVLPGWTDGTPRAILEGAAAPVIAPEHPPSNGRVSAVISSGPDDPAFWVALADEVPKATFDELWRLYLERKALRHALTERDYQADRGERERSRSEDDPQ